MTPGRAGRLNAESYYGAALALLAADGKDGLTIAALCQRLEVTKGSFYHHFSDLADFEQQLLAFWEREHAGRILLELADVRDPRVRLDATIDFGVDLAHGTEAAIRAWARGDSSVAEMVARVDDSRMAFVVDTLVELGLTPDQARVMTRLGLNTMVGAQMRGADVDASTMRENLEELQRFTLSLAPPDG